MTAAGFLNANSPLLRILRELADRTFNLDPARNPSFAAANNDYPLSQNTILTPTPLLKWLALRHKTRWNTLQAAFSNLFDEVREIIFEDFQGSLLPKAQLRDGSSVSIDNMGFHA
jgi:hypothetical protein